MGAWFIRALGLEDNTAISVGSEYEITNVRMLIRAQKIYHMRPLENMVEIKAKMKAGFKLKEGEAYES